MDLKTYTDLARRTALPTAYDYQYLAPGLVSEVGELYGVEAKTHRDDLPLATHHHKMVGEWGDVAWVTALLVHHTGTLLDAEGTPYRTPGRPAGQVPADAYPLPYMLAYATKIDRIAGDETKLLDIYNCAYALWYLLEDYAEVMTGQPFVVVLQNNLDKLLSRQSRGVLGGSGDNR